MTFISTKKEDIAPKRLTPHKPTEPLSMQLQLNRQVVAPVGRVHIYLVQISHVLMQDSYVLRAYLANAFTSTTPGGLEHARILDPVATGQGILHRMHTRPSIDISRNVALALLEGQTDL